MEAGFLVELIVGIILVAVLALVIYTATLLRKRPGQASEWDDSTQLYEWKDRVRRNH